MYLPVCPRSFQFPGALCKIAVFPLKRDELFDPRHWLAVSLPKLGLEVPGIEVADGPGAKDVQNSLGFGREMGRFRSERISWQRRKWADPEQLAVGGIVGSQKTVGSQRRTERDPAHAGRQVRQKVAAVEQVAAKEQRDSLLDTIKYDPQKPSWFNFRFAANF